VTAMEVDMAPRADWAAEIASVMAFPPFGSLFLCIQ
jgi:hypothetical protein